jgi:hypothetical protein
MRDKKFHAAQILIRHTFMNEHEAFKTTDCEINQIDWDKIDDGEYTLNQWRLVQVLKFLLDHYCEFELSELNNLSEDDRQVVILALSERYSTKSLEENL